MCAEITPTKGYCTYTISDNEFFVEGTIWSDLKRKSLIMPAESYAEVKAYILKMCKKHSDCSNNLGKWERKFSNLDDKTNRK